MGANMSREFNVIIERDEDGYFVASVPELRGCHTQAKSLDLLIKRVKEAINLCLEVEEPVSNEFVGIQRVAISSWVLSPQSQVINLLKPFGNSVLKLSVRREVTTSCAIRMGGARLYRYIVEKRLGADSLLKSFEIANSPEKISRKFSEILVFCYQ